MFFYCIDMSIENVSNENMGNDNMTHLPDDNTMVVVKPSIDEVDQLADELAAEFNNHAWRSWYCGYINRYGIAQINEWREKARRGRYPDRLFSVYLTQARKNGVPEVSNFAPKKHDEILTPNVTGIPTSADVDAFVGVEIDKFIITNLRDVL